MRLAPFASRYAGNAMVCAIDHLATEAGVAILREGGSAADAAVAASAVLAVTNQHMCGMGGDLFALVQEDGTAPVALNASGRAGSGADPDRLRGEGHSFMPRTGDIRCVPVPGCVDGWLALHSRYGRLPLARVLEAAMVYADEGFPASLSLTGAAQSVQALPGGEDFSAATHPGAIVRRPGVARALRAVAAGGRAGFYGGEFGEGLLRLGAGEYVGANLATSFADWVEPLSVEAFGSRIWTTPPNSQGYLPWRPPGSPTGSACQTTPTTRSGPTSVSRPPARRHTTAPMCCTSTPTAPGSAPERLAARRAAISPTRRRCCPAVTPRATRSTCRRGSRPDGCLVDPVERRQLRL